MPRQSRSSRPAARAAPARSASTAAAPAHGGYGSNAAHAPAPPAAAAAATGSSGPGMIAQMAATAGSVAVGSTIGHGLSSMLFGGSSHAAPAPEAPPAAAPTQNYNSGMSCEVQAKDFTRCLEKADMQSCSYYLEQLKACQAAAAPY
ncbi:hypothetical protein BDV98DRAFT_562451 [Pterulicium gracile]|uniref:CHCH domain-containing protein n=1 Tax=Pterulicium gracile TaxID=1884261 RepID=A0A5C3QRQ2_9AGAR|nr:hypothetical protein BDV98DRAFT_562451 [Pterula gracilis]